MGVEASPVALFLERLSEGVHGIVAGRPDRLDLEPQKGLGSKNGVVPTESAKSP